MVDMYEWSSNLVSMMTLNSYKVTLKKKGYTYRQAAPLLGLKNFQSLSRILNGEYQNRRVIAAIKELPPMSDLENNQPPRSQP